MRFAVDSICKGAPLSDQVKALKTNREVIGDFVSKTPDAIGIIGVNWLSDHVTAQGSQQRSTCVMSVSAADKATPENSLNPIRHICLVIIRWHNGICPVKETIRGHNFK